MQQVEYSVCLTRHPLPAGGYLAQVTLNAPQRLNALAPEMAELLQRFLLELRDDPEALCVFLDAEGDRAFCVGADARRMLKSALANPGGAAVEAEAFMASEYSVAHLIHTYSKPIICWGHGLVMGSGLGFLTGASHRIVTESSCLSMPEVKIGLFPNAGAGWYLRHMPGRTGLFVAITASELSAADALYAGLADYCFADADKATLLKGLLSLDWDEDADSNNAMLTEYLTDLEVESGMTLMPSPLKQHRQWIDQACEKPSVEQVVAEIRTYSGQDDWLVAAVKGLGASAASSVSLVFKALERCQRLSLSEVLRLELVLMANRIRDPEFAEGVRARLLDRDCSPNWCYPDIAAVPVPEVDALFVAPWPSHPLAGL
jgi:enoyl-CoA hydratase/carnithine racemase